MNKAEIESWIKSTLAELLGVTQSELKSDALLYESLGADDLDFSEIVMKIEDKFKLDFPQTLERLITVQSLIEYVYCSTEKKSS